MQQMIHQIIQKDLRLADGSKIYKIPISEFRETWVYYLVAFIMVAMLIIVTYYMLILKKAFDDSDEFYWDQIIME